MSKKVVLFTFLLSTLAFTSGYATHRIGSVQVFDPPRSAGSGCGETVYQFSHLDDPEADPADPEAVTKFLILHFISSMECDDSLEVDLGNGQVDVFDCTSDSDGMIGNGRDFWTRPIKGNLARITFDGGAVCGGSVEVDRYGRGEEIDLFLLSEPLSEPLDHDPTDFDPAGICPAGHTPSWENVACLSDDDEHQRLFKEKANSVGLIVAARDAGGAGDGCDVHCDEVDTHCPDRASNACLSSCTATLVGPDKVLTAEHCFGSDSEIRSASFSVGFQTDCDGNRPDDDYAPAFHKVSDVLERENPCSRDFSFLRLDADVTEAEPVLIRPTVPPVNEELFVVHHPQGTTKKISRQPTDSDCSVFCRTSTKLFYACDSDHGSSGSPVFDSDGKVVAVNRGFGGGCPYAMQGELVTPDVEESCVPEEDTNYVLDSMTAELPGGDRPLGPEDMVRNISVTYHFDGVPCEGAPYEHRLYLADVANPGVPIGDVITWSDPADLMEGEVTIFEAPDLAVGCPLRNDGTYVVVAELNHRHLPTEHDYLDNDGSVDLGQACFPDLQMIPSDIDGDGLSEAVVRFLDADGLPTAFCDVDGCKFDQPLTALVIACNAGCAPMGPFDMELWLHGDVLGGALPLCIDDVGERILSHRVAGLPAAPAGGPPHCEVIEIPVNVPEPRIPATLYRICAIGDPDQDLVDCSVGRDIACTTSFECEDPCVIDDNCVGGLFPDDDDDGDGEGGDCPLLGCFGPILDCCVGPDPQPCWAYFAGAAGPLCGDPRIDDLLDFGLEINDVVQATDPGVVTQALQRILQRIVTIPEGINVAPALLAFAESEAAGLMGSPGISRRDLGWTHRLFDAWDLDLRTGGLEVPVSVPAGQNVSVQLGGGIALTFDAVQAPGTVTPRFRLFGPGIPLGFHGPVPLYNVDLQSSVEMAAGSGVTVTMDYSALSFRPGAEVHLFREEGGVLVDRTLTTDPSARTVTGRVYGFSRFMLLGTGGVTAIDCPPDRTIACQSDTTPASTGFAMAAGNGGPITVDYDDRLLFQMGGHVIKRAWIAIDDLSGARCEQTIALVDTAPPLLTCPTSMTAQCQGGQVHVSLPGAVATDDCGGPVTIANSFTPGGADASGLYPAGTTAVTFTATDPSGHSSTCAIDVTVPDTDGDSVPDACDCAPGDPSAWAMPGEVMGLRASRTLLDPDSVELSWGSLAAQAGPGVVYDVITGTLSSLRANHGFAEVVCLVSDSQVTDIVKAQPQPDPPLPDGFWYLVRAENACGTGTWGDGTGVPDPRDVLDQGNLCETQAPLLSVAKTDSPDPVVAGGNLTYTLSYGNSGNAGATGVVITDTVPASTTFVSATGGGTLAPGGVVTWSLGALASGATGSVQMVVRVASPLPDGTQIANDAYSIDSDDTAPVSGAPVTTRVSSPVLALSKTDSPDPVAAGGNITYTLILSNTGGAGATGVVVLDVVPQNTTFISATDGGALILGGIVRWNIGLLPAGGSHSVQMVVRVASPLADGTLITNANYNIDSNETDKVFGAAVTTTVSAPALSVVKTDSPDPVLAGSDITYTLVLSNNGTGNATGVVVTDTVPTSTSFVSATSGGVLGPGGVVTWSLGTLGAGTTQSVQMVARVIASAPNGLTITNVAYDIDSNETAPVGGAFVTTTVVSPPVLHVSKVDSSDPVAAGSNLTYTLSYSNTGGLQATGVTLGDTVPANTTFVSATGGGTLLPGGVVTWNLGTLAPGAPGSVQMTVRVAFPLADGTVLSNNAYSIDCNETAPVSGAPVTTTVVALPILAIDMDVSTPTVIDSTRVLSGPVSSLDVGIIVDARASSGLGDIAKVPFGVINAFNLGGATVSAITPLSIVDIMPPSTAPNNATFSGLTGEFQFGNALTERGVPGSGFTGGPVQYARFRIFFGTQPTGSTVRVFIGDRGPGSLSVRNKAGLDISGDFTADGTPVLGTPGSDEGPGAGMSYRDGSVVFGP